MGIVMPILIMMVFVAFRMGLLMLTGVVTTVQVTAAVRNHLFLSRGIQRRQLLQKSYHVPNVRQHGFAESGPIAGGGQVSSRMLSLALLVRASS